jgi:O-methyltransferase
MSAGRPRWFSNGSSSLRNVLKRSRTIHSLYKLGYRLPEAPLSQWLKLSRTRSIFRVLPNTMVSAPRLMNAFDTAVSVEREELEGSIVECGVWAGGAIGLMADVSKRHGNRHRMFHLFDSFEGLPQPSVFDADVLGAFTDEHPELEPDSGQDSTSLVAIGACEAPLEEVHTLFFDVLRIDRRQVVIHKGWFQDTVPTAAESVGPIALLRIDGDWYESTKTCLDYLYDQVIDGGFVIIDDYGTFVGCAKAVDEFLESRGVEVDLVPIDEEGVFFRKTDRAAMRSIVA